MGQSKPIEIAGHSYDPETIDVLRRLLDDIWAQLTETQRNPFPRSLIAQRLLLAAAAGERDPDALRARAVDGAGDIVAPLQPGMAPP